MGPGPVTEASITQVATNQLPEVMALIKLAVAEMEKQQIFQWDDIYPDVATLAEDIQTETLFGFFIGEHLAGIVVLNTEEPPEYQHINWHYYKPLVVHRLCVHPHYQKKGIAKKLMFFAEQFARKNNYASIRLDTMVENPIAGSLYRKLNYAERGHVIFRKGNFVCFEKLIA